MNGTVNSSSALHPAAMSSPIFLTPVGIVSVFRPVQFSNANDFTCRTLSGRTMLSTDVTPANARSPMPVTGKPSQVTGTVTSRPTSAVVPDTQ